MGCLSNGVDGLISSGDLISQNREREEDNHRRRQNESRLMTLVKEETRKIEHRQILEGPAEHESLLNSSNGSMAGSISHYD